MIILLDTLELNVEIIIICNTFKAPSKNVAYNFFFFYFTEKIKPSISCEIPSLVFSEIWINIMHHRVN